MLTTERSEAPLGARAALLLLAAGLVAIAGSVWLWQREVTARDALWGFIEGWSDRTNRHAVARAWWFLSELGHGYTLTLVIGAVIVYGGSRRLLQDAVALTVGASLVTNLLKLLVARDRPFHAIEQATPAWPSGHATACLALALAFLGHGRACFVTLPLALLAGLARVAHFRHWPSDVLGGYGVALCCAAALLSLPTLLPAVVVARQVRIALAAGLFAFVLADIAVATVEPIGVGYLQMIVAVPALLVAARGLRLAAPAG